MVTIILCDDDPFTLQLLSELLERAIRQSRGQLVCLASAGQEPLQFIRSGGSYLYFLDYDLGRDSPQRRGPCPADLPHGPRRENRLCYRPWEEGHGYSAQRRAGLWVY